MKGACIVRKTGVLIIDDSAAVRSILTRELSAYEEITVTGAAGSPYAARDAVEHTDFDVVILDIDMPRLDGLAFIGYLAERRPVPVIVMSSFVTPGNRSAVQALEKGAVYAVHKPGGPFSVEEFVGELYREIREAAMVSVQRLYDAARRLESSGLNETGRIKRSPVSSRLQPDGACDGRLTVVGVTTGGVAAFEELFTQFAEGRQPVAAVIRLPEYVTAQLAERLDGMCGLHVKEAEDGEKPAAGTVYIAPGGRCMTVAAAGSERRLRIARGMGQSGEAHPVDELFTSAAETYGKGCTAILVGT
ncbi:MAG TPA: hypothetical protein DCL73_05800 [Treponema sp.]|nr:hypothetical protein [Treponema sp.]